MTLQAAEAHRAEEAFQERYPAPLDEVRDLLAVARALRDADTAK